MRNKWPRNCPFQKIFFYVFIQSSTTIAWLSKIAVCLTKNIQGSKYNRHENNFNPGVNFQLIHTLHVHTVCSYDLKKPLT